MSYVVDDDAIVLAPDPWDRTVAETDQEWELFLRYRESAYPEGYQGPFKARSKKAFALSEGAEAGAITNLARRRDWARRSSEFDRAIEKLKFDATRDYVSKFQQRNIEMLDAGMSLVREHMRRGLDGAWDPLTDVLPPDRVASAFRTLFEVERLIMGKSTANVAVNHEHKIDIKDLTPEERDVIRKLDKKLRGAG